MKEIVIKAPRELADKFVIASVSGGKDSTAMILALREAEIPARYVFADTQWEAAETYEYLDTLRSRLKIRIDTVRSHRGGMEDQIIRNMRFPSRMQRWCTRNLKIRPLRGYHDKVEQELGVETVSALGIRADESVSRSKQPEWSDDDAWGGFVWRPLLRWSIADVLEIHHRHDIPVNPLYRAGHDRVGCYPCIFSSKNDIRLVAQHAPKRIDLIATLEARVSAERAQALREGVRRFRNPDVDATFFQARGSGCARIADVVSWAKTSRGGRQLSLLTEPPTGGCVRWGLCDPPASK